MRGMVTFIRNCSDHLNIIGGLLSLEWERLVYLRDEICGFHQGLFSAVLAAKTAIIYP